MSYPILTIVGMDTALYESCSTAELADAVGQLSAAHNALHRALLEVILAYDEREAWREDGSTNMATWLMHAVGISRQAAYEWVRVAGALKNLPLISDAFAEGVLTWDKVRSLTKVATPENEEELLAEGERLLAPQVETLARRLRPTSESEAEEAHQKRCLYIDWDFENKWLRINGRIPDIDGAAVQKALDHLVDTAPYDSARVVQGMEQRYADALVELASTFIEGKGDGNRATVVVHVDAEVLDGKAGVAEIDGGPIVSSQTVQQLICDGYLEVHLDGADGQPVGIGRRSRKVPAWLMRKLLHRDGGCVFDGCTRKRWLNAHHIDPWAKGGVTDLNNLTLLCGHHHRLVHPGGWTMRGRPDGKLEFVSPSGKVLPARPPRLRAEVRERLLALDIPMYHRGREPLVLDEPRELVGDDY